MTTATAVERNVTINKWDSIKRLKVLTSESLWLLQDLIDDEIAKRSEEDKGIFALALKDYVDSLSPEEQKFMQIRILHPKAPVTKLAEECGIPYNRALDLVKNSSFQAGMRYELAVMGWNERESVRTLLKMARSNGKNAIEAQKMLLKLCDVDIESKKQPQVQITKNTQINANNVNVLERLESMLEIYKSGDRR